MHVGGPDRLAEGVPAGLGANLAGRCGARGHGDAGIAVQGAAAPRDVGELKWEGAIEAVSRFLHAGRMLIVMESEAGTERDDCRLCGATRMRLKSA